MTSGSYHPASTVGQRRRKASLEPEAALACATGAATLEKMESRPEELPEDRKWGRDSLVSPHLARAPTSRLLPLPPPGRSSLQGRMGVTELEIPPPSCHVHAAKHGLLHDPSPPLPTPAPKIEAKPNQTAEWFLCEITFRMKVVFVIVVLFFLFLFFKKNHEKGTYCNKQQLRNYFNL